MDAIADLHVDVARGTFRVDALVGMKFGSDSGVDSAPSRVGHEGLLEVKARAPWLKMFLVFGNEYAVNRLVACRTASRPAVVRYKLVPCANCLE